MSSSAFTPAVLTVSSGAGAGSGEKNYITNPSAASAITGWGVVGDFTLSRTTAASDLPREYSTATGIKVVATSAVQSTADYIYFDFNLDDVDLGKKLKIQWSQKKIGTYSAGQLAVVITTQADRTTALITPQTTAIPASDLDFVTSFDATTTAALSLVIRATTDMTTGDGICISDVVVGPGTITQGAAISEWTPYTPTVSTGTWTNTRGYYRRVGSSIELKIYAGPLTANGSGLYTWTLPLNLTADLTALGASGVTPSLVDTDGGSNTIVQVGTATLNAQGSVWYMDGISASGLTDARVSLASTTTLAIIAGSGTTANRLDAFGSGNNGSSVLIVAQIEARIPIAEFSGSGTVSLGAGAQVEYAYNSSTSTTANDTSSFAYGPQGAKIQAITAALNRTVRFQYPIQTDDILTLQVSSDQRTWLDLDAIRVIGGSGISPYVTQNGAFYGAGIYSADVNGTDVSVRFGTYEQPTSTYGAVGEAWRAGGSDQYWRVRKAKASSPVGFGKADSTSFGLVGPRKGQYSLTVTGTGWTTTRAIGIYYQDQDGNHRLKFNIAGTVSSATRTSYVITLTGVTFKNGAGLQVCSAMGYGAAVIIGTGYPNANQSVLNIEHASATSTQYSWGGDLELESKPSWA